MTPEQDKKLCRDFPILYRNRTASMMTTCMCWGFECGSGWFDLIYDLSFKLECINRRIYADLPFWRKALLVFSSLASKVGIVLNVAEPDYIVAEQVKEKFGSGRFYYSGGGRYDETAFRLVGEFENASSMTCEACGKPGRIREGGWLKCRCECHEE